MMNAYILLLYAHLCSTVSRDILTLNKTSAAGAAPGPRKGMLK